jgi:hypothetical protein
MILREYKCVGGLATAGMPGPMRLRDRCCGQPTLRCAITAGTRWRDVYWQHGGPFREPFPASLNGGLVTMAPRPQAGSQSSPLSHASAIGNMAVRYGCPGTQRSDPTTLEEESQSGPMQALSQEQCRHL